MKLLRCIECNDIFKLTSREKRYCWCKKTSGICVNERDVEISGPCIPIGIHNGFFNEAVKAQLYGNKHKIEQDAGLLFKAFTIPDSSPTIKRMDVDEDKDGNKPHKP